MRYTAGISTASVGLVALLVACGPGPDDMRELREGQREIRAKLTDMEKKIDQIASRPAGAPQAAAGQPDPNKVYTIPAGDSPSKGPANAPVLMVEFSDFQ